MVYNRCVGTRYCSNNCPYKVRRFNFPALHRLGNRIHQAAKKPRCHRPQPRVMEKCTFCIQRINYAKIMAEKEDRRVKDGEIVTACQATCPAEAIAFGDLNDPESKVSRSGRKT